MKTIEGISPKKKKICIVVPILLHTHTHTQTHEENVGDNQTLGLKVNYFAVQMDFSYDNM